MKPISIARDLGTIVEVASGVTTSDRVIDSPPDGLMNGTLVNLEGTGPTSVADGKQKGSPDRG
jgi:hypothetical protein